VKVNVDVLAELLAQCRVIDLAHPMVQGMPQSPNHTPFRMALQRRHGDHVRADGGSAANEIIVTGGHVGTHIDALCHVSQDGLLHGGLDARAAQTGGSFRTLGIETVAPLLGRGVLLDIAGHRGTAPLPPGLPVTADHLDACATAQGMDVRAGDVVLVRTGWSLLWHDREAFIGHESGVPGVDVSGARWLAEHGVRAAGSDTIAFEVVAAGAGHTTLPVHSILLVEHGIHIIETLRLDELAELGHHEFAIVLVPLAIAGATGSPVRPLALV
jgi:kynurenine formamidase